MAYDIHIATEVAALLEELPERTRGVLHERLARVAEAAEVWPVEDPRWEQLARPGERGLWVHAGGCCLRLQLQPLFRRLVVREGGLVRVQLPDVRPPLDDGPLLPC